MDRASSTRSLTHLSTQKRRKEASSAGNDSHDEEKVREAVQKAENEKESIRREIKELKKKWDTGDVNLEHELSGIGKKWEESPKLVERSLKDLAKNVEDAAELKYINKEVTAELTSLANRAERLKNEILSSKSHDLYQEKITRLSIKHHEKVKMKKSIEKAISTNISQRDMIFKVIEKLVTSLTSQLFSEKIQYYDLKYYMCTALQEYQKLKLKYTSTKAQLISSFRKISPLSPPPCAENSQSPSPFPLTPKKVLLERKGGDSMSPAYKSLFKDKSLTLSHISQTSNVSRRYNADPCSSSSSSTERDEKFSELFPLKISPIQTVKNSTKSNTSVIATLQKMGGDVGAVLGKEGLRDRDLNVGNNS